MPPPTQLPNQQLPSRENGLFKKVVVCLEYLILIIYPYIID
jgi:hypothetical protein